MYTLIAGSCSLTDTDPKKNNCNHFSRTMVTSSWYQKMFTSGKNKRCNNVNNCRKNVG